MPRMIVALAGALALLGSAPSHAAETGEEAIDCTNPMATHEQNVCAEKDLAAADARLNDIYQRVLKRIPELSGEKPYDAKSFEDALRTTQRTWVAFRDADCKGLVPMSWGGGSATTAQVLGCLVSRTKERGDELRDRYLLE